MAAKTMSLRYTGKGSLTFGNAKGERVTVRPGDEFETDAATAETLLAGSPKALMSVSQKPAEPGPVTLPAGAKLDPNAPPMTEASPDVASSEADPLAAAPPEGGTLPAPGPTMPASSAVAGTITLADLPDSAKKSPAKSSK